MLHIKYNLSHQAGIFLFVLLSSLYTAKAQENNSRLSGLEPLNDTMAQSVLYINAGSTISYASVALNYDHLLWTSNTGFFKGYYANFEVGAYVFPSLAGSLSEGVISTLGMVGLTGKRRSHFEVGLGVSALFDSNGEILFPAPDITLGYRYQRENGFVFRTGLGFIQGLYFSLGYSF